MVNGRESSKTFNCRWVRHPLHRTLVRWRSGVPFRHQGISCSPRAGQLESATAQSASVPHRSHG